MAKIVREQWVPYRPEQMYQLVNDVPHYPKFLPFCHHAACLAQTDDRMTATVQIQKGPISFQWTTENHLFPPERIEMNLVEGPFRQLSGVWDFKPQAGGTRVSLTLTFEFQNQMLKMALNPLFKHLMDRIVQAFYERANVVFANHLKGGSHHADNER